MQGGDTMAMINAIWPFILMGGIFYFMLYRPQKQEQQKRQRMLDSLKKGDKVVTIGGMFGVITAISEKKVTLKLDRKSTRLNSSHIEESRMPSSA